jgi:hypothetical protein
MTFGISYVIYDNIKKENYNYSLELLKNNTNEISSQEYYSFLIRIYNGKKEYQKVENILLDSNLKLMKRDYFSYILEIFNDDIEKSILFFKLILKKYNLNTKDIDFLINNNILYLLKILNNYYMTTSLKSNIEELSKINFKVIDFDPYLINSICNKLKLNIFKNYYNNLITRIESKKYNYVLDGGNILFSIKGKNSMKGYKLLFSIMKKLKEENPLLIIHNKYLKLKNKSKGISKIIKKLKDEFIDNIFMTPYKNNDDYYILLSSLKKNIPIISNDNFNDHKYLVCEEMLNNYIDRYVLKYNYLEIDELKTYSNCIQIIDKVIYVPSESGNFFKVN